LASIEISAQHCIALKKGIEMKWEYQIVKAETSDAFQASLNALGADGWEAISGAYMLGEPKRTALGHGMPLTTTPGAPIWMSTMKRALA
jgi:hypothetical protein